MTDNPQRIVADGYDAIAERYLEWIGHDLSPGRLHALGEIREYVNAGAPILELGCGAGVPMTRLLARSWRVHGVDISPRQVELARASVPDATFECADMTDVTLAPSSIAGCVAFYSLTHVKRDLVPGLLARIHQWLVPGGVLVASFGTRDDPGTVEPDWLGAPMYFSHFDAEANQAMVSAASLEILTAVTIDEQEDDGPAPFLWITARKPSAT